jgi:hypothetical protein
MAVLANVQLHAPTVALRNLACSLAKININLCSTYNVIILPCDCPPAEWPEAPLPSQAPSPRPDQ